MESFESRPFFVELLSDLKRQIQLRNWIIAGLAGLLPLLILVAKRDKHEKQASGQTIGI